MPWSDMPWSDVAAIAGVTLSISVVIGAVCLLALLLLRRTPIMVQLGVVILSGIASVIVSMLWVARLMYLSQHDLVVGIYVSAIAGTVSLIVGVALGLLVTRSSRALSRAAHRIGEGELVVAPARPVNAELAHLADELASTSTKLREAHERTAAVETSRRELVAWISHDLRTPLAGIRAMSEALEDSITDDPERYHRQLRAQVDQLSSMVDDLFQLSKIDSGTLQLSLQEVSLLDIVSDTVADLRHVALDRPVLVESALDSDLMVLVDPRELSRAIGNLVMNALQYTPHPAPITVRVELVEGRPTVSVIDNGGGISDADIERLFEPGWRGSPARTPVNGDASSSGAGLGLAIVRGILDAHRGDVEVRNVGGGARFDLVLPSDAALTA